MKRAMGASGRVARSVYYDATAINREADKTCVVVGKATLCGVGFRSGGLHRGTGDVRNWIRQRLRLRPHRACHWLGFEVCVSCVFKCATTSSDSFISSERLLKFFEDQ